MKSLRVGMVALSIMLPVASFGETVIIVNPKNPLNILAPDQLEKLFLAKRSDFPGGGMAKAVNLPEGNKLREEFYDKTSHKDAAQLKSYWARLIFTGKALPLKELASEAEIKKYVASTLEGIGYVDKGSLDNTVKSVAAVQ